MNELERLADRITSFDWTYEYADDHSAWRAAHTEKARLRSAITELLSEQRDDVYDMLPEKVRSNHFFLMYFGELFNKD